MKPRRLAAGDSKESAMQTDPPRRKHCFVLRVRPDMLEEYRERHARVWPEMLRELERAGRVDYSLFLHSDGLLVGYYEAEDDAAGAELLAASAIAKRWEDEMSPFFFADGSRPDQNVEKLDLVFDLDAQLAALD
jgi:L-rhamnose mutarotase